MPDLKLDKDTRARLNEQIRQYLSDELDTDIGNMEADFLIDFLSGSLGASFYNLGLKDAQALIARKMDDINDELYGMEQPDDPVL
ncbi:DUF2164 domain-containing protein [Roseibium alexandrii]|uniref:DUF2164 domain-containing protein n=1 Tax=Roseibium alexandrii (strain DSM 17067 / NCIMB 14079 / DFL-11) TaxID=244592 RepID=A0A5E8H2M8_ROSAD|nr:DUF2164 domain-containing protein [Roseibium alexandrii]EEE46860.1 hypothetical protein SADFL11_4149 [Roseibium alexandrii DFL-11]